MAEAYGLRPFCPAGAEKQVVSRLANISNPEELIAQARGGDEAAQATIDLGTTTLPGSLKSPAGLLRCPKAPY